MEKAKHQTVPKVQSLDSKERLDLIHHSCVFRLLWHSVESLSASLLVCCVGGCNHMVCVSCRFEFCWLCSVSYKVGHYALDEKSPCYGKQYT
jgi:hypothetical protein